VRPIQGSHAAWGGGPPGPRGRRHRVALVGAALLCCLIPAVPALAAATSGAGSASRAAPSQGGAGASASSAASGSKASSSAGGASDSLAAAIKALAPVEQAYALLLRHYAGRVNPQGLVQGALNGMVQAVQNPFTQYLPPQQDAAFTGTLEGYGGIGVEIVPTPEGAVVNSVLAGGPAYRAGLRSGDLIVSVDGHSTVGASLGAIGTWVRGAPGTPVTLAVQEPGQAHPERLVLRRSQILPPSVFASMPQPRVGLIRITSFTSETGTAFAAAYRGLQHQAGPGGLRGLVLDLRNNGGGFVSAALSVLDLLAPPGPLFQIVEAGGRVLRYSAPAHAPAPPMVVLVNGGTASAAEIVAGVLQYTHAAELVGSRTYGKGSVQQIFSLPGGGGLKITVAHDELPDGASWNHVGLQPNVVVAAAPAPWTQVPNFAAVGSRPLHAGMVGLDVLGLQQRLTFLGYRPGPENGIYDPETAAAVRAFELRNGLAATGAVDAADWKALNAVLVARVLQLQATPPPDTVLRVGLQVLDRLVAAAGH
jgi:carboxyl-terminal processing protease